MGYIEISEAEYKQLLKYRDIINRIEEEIHEELNVKPITDKRAIAKLTKLEKEAKEGKRKTVSKEEFLAEFGEE